MPGDRTLVDEPDLSLNASSFCSGSLLSSEAAEVEPTPSTKPDITVFDAYSRPTFISPGAMKKIKRKAADISNEIRAKI